MNFQDISSYTAEEKIMLFKERYGRKLNFAGKKNGVVERIITLNKNSKPNPERLAVIEGIWALTLAGKYDIRVKHLVICPDLIKSIESQNLADHFINKCNEATVVSERIYAQLAEKDNGQGIMAVIYLDYTDYREFRPGESSVIVILDGLEIPGNVGTILRSSESVGAELVILNNRKVRLNHPKLLRSSMGSLFKVPVSEAENTDELIEWLEKEGYRIILADTASHSMYFDNDFKGRIALVMGSEKYGISDDFYKVGHEDVMIPMLGDMDSLNVGVAATILLYEAGLKNRGIIKR